LPTYSETKGRKKDNTPHNNNKQMPPRKQLIQMNCQIIHDLLEKANNLEVKLLSVESIK